MEKNRTEIFAKYQDEIHLLGRIGLTVGLGLLLGLPFAFGKVLNASVNWSAFWKGALQVLPVYLPSCIVEFMVYVPMMGAGASYLGFITGNMVNLRSPAWSTAGISASPVTPWRRRSWPPCPWRPAHW